MLYVDEENNFALIIIIHHNKIHLIALFLTKILIFVVPP